MNNVFRKVAEAVLFLRWPLLLIFSLAGAAVGIFGMIIFIFHSHRVAGPLYRFEKDLEKIAQGNLTLRLNLRKKDEFQGLAKSLNRFTEEMDSRINLLKKEIELLSGSPSRENLPELQETVNRLKKITDRFKTSS